MADFNEIIEVKKTMRENEANELLQKGWILLSVGFVQGEAPGYGYHSYSLGKPIRLKLQEDA